MKKRLYCLVALLGAFAHQTSAQETNSDTLKSRDIAPVTITATRYESDKNRTPFAITVMGKNRLQTAQQQLSVHDALTAIPGIFVQNPDNFSQDLRISVRGFGARAAFGIRGVRIITDGIPESTPDGQADVDNLDAGLMSQMQVIRGPAAGLYGNGAGGVIYFQTEEPSAQPYAEVQASGGSYGFQRYQAKTGFEVGKMGVFFSAAHHLTEGYRDHATMSQTVLNTKLKFNFNDKTRLSVLLNYGNSPWADDAGGLTQEQVAANRRQARVQSVQFDAGEAVEQGRVGAVLQSKISDKHSFQARVFTTFRNFSNKLPVNSSGWVEFERLFGGGGVQYEFKTPLLKRPYRMQLGLDIDRQRDYRQRFNNINGVKGARVLEQNEKFQSIGAFWLHEWTLFQQDKSELLFTASTRFDKVTLSNEDKFLTDGNQSGSIPLRRFSPLAGLVYKINNSISTYVNFSSNFETPTLNELSSNPSNTGGFNPDLKPQKSISYELGIKTQMAQKWSFDAALFLIDLKEEFVSYQLAQFPGRTFFRNAGVSQRKGVELGAALSVLSDVTFYANYTYSDFKFQDFQQGTINFKGNRQAGIPLHTAYFEGRWEHKSGFTGIAQVRYVGEMFANDANTFENAAYTVAILRGGYRTTFKQWAIEPFAGVNNLFDAQYNSNVQINAAANRFYEPAAGRFFYGGVKLGIRN